MLTVTQAAGSLLSDLLGDARAPDEVAVRFVIEQQGLVLKLDSPRPGDESFDHDGRTVLLLDEDVSSALEKSTLDVKHTEEGPRLAVT